MMEFVQDYLDGKFKRLDFDLDFAHYLVEQYPKMERECGELADCFNFYLAEEGYDQSHDLSDSEHKRLIQRQYNEFMLSLHSDIL